MAVPTSSKPGGMLPPSIFIAELGRSVPWQTVSSPTCPVASARRCSLTLNTSCCRGDRRLPGPAIPSPTPISPIRGDCVGQRDGVGIPRRRGSVGAEGVVGISRILAIPRHPYRVVALLESAGHRLPIDALWRTFDELKA